MQNDVGCKIMYTLIDVDRERCFLGILQDHIHPLHCIIMYRTKVYLEIRCISYA